MVEWRSILGNRDGGDGGWLHVVGAVVGGVGSELAAEDHLTHPPHACRTVHNASHFIIILIQT